MAKGAAKVKIGKTLQYGAISITVQGAEKTDEFGNAKCQDGFVFLVADLKLENTKSASTAFIVPDEEIWLNFGAETIAKPENYKFETALDKGKPTEGYVFYKVPEGAKKFSLLFGKKTLPKAPADFEF